MGNHCFDETISVNNLALNEDVSHSHWNKLYSGSKLKFLKCCVSTVKHQMTANECIPRCVWVFWKLLLL